MQIHVSKLRENKKKDSILIFSMKTKVNFTVHPPFLFLEVWKERNVESKGK